MLRAPGISQVVPTFPGRGGKTAPSPEETDWGETEPEREGKLEQARRPRSHAGPSALRFLPGDTAAAALRGLKGDAAFVVFPWSFNPCTICIPATAFQTLGGFCPEFLFLFSPRLHKLFAGFSLGFCKIASAQNLSFSRQIIPPPRHNQTSLHYNRKAEQKRNSG